MKRALAIGIPIVVVIGLVAAVPITNRITTNHYRELLEQGIHERYGGTLKLDDFRVNLFQATVTLEGYHYAEPENDTYRLQVDGGPLRARLDAPSLRPKSVRFKELTLEKPRIRLVRTPRGDWDKGIPGIARDLLSLGLEKAKKALGIDDLAIRKEGGAVSVKQEERKVTFGRLSIRHANVAYEDNRFEKTPIKLTLRDFGFEGKDITGANFFTALLSSEVNGILQIGTQEVDVAGRLRDVAGEEHKIWTLDARGIHLAPIAGPILRPLRIDLKSGDLDLHISHLVDLSIAKRSTIVMDYSLVATGVDLEILESATIPLLNVPAERIKEYVDSHEGRVALSFSVEATPDLALLGKEAGSVLEVVGKLTLTALRRKLMEAIGIAP